MCSRFLVILIGVMLIAGCREGGGSGFSYSGGYTGGGSDSASIGSGGAAHTSVGLNPEPSTLALFSIGLAGLVYSMFGRKKR